MSGETTQEKLHAVSVGSTALFGFRVHLYVAGKHGGFYRHETEADALADMKQRTSAFGVLHCYYQLERPKPRCPACTRHAELMSGLGLWHDLPDCDHLPNKADMASGNQS